MASWNEEHKSGSMQAVSEEAKGSGAASVRSTWRSELCAKMALSSEAVIVSEACAPGKIVACNAVWSELCGYEADEAFCHTPKILQGKGTSVVKASQFADAVRSNNTYTHSEELGFATRQAVNFVKLLNYTKSGRPFVHCLKTWRTQDEDTGAEYFVTESYEEQGTAVSRAVLRAAGVASAEENAASASNAQLAATIILPLLVAWPVLQAVACMMNSHSMPMV
uniref:PAS domain-containing protein n=1 Tax=Coccolithus braarudii TaxID=221442 RepID=A0A7S0L8W0_9EUKA